MTLMFKCINMNINLQSREIYHSYVMLQDKIINFLITSLTKLFNKIKNTNFITHSNA